MNITLGDCAFTAVAVRSPDEIVISLFITFVKSFVSFIFFSIGQRELNELSE